MPGFQVADMVGDIATGVDLVIAIKNKIENNADIGHSTKIGSAGSVFMYREKSMEDIPEKEIEKTILRTKEKYEAIAFKGKNGPLTTGEAASEEFVDIMTIPKTRPEAASEEFVDIMTIPKTR